MKIVFWASAEIAVPTLMALVQNNYEVLGVVTAPDAKKGRHLITSFTPIKEFALKHNLEIFQPVSLLEKEAISFLKKLDSDIFVVFAYGKIISKELLMIPRLFSINIHASLLPKYRGAAPINWALMDGENKTGITLIRMNEIMDEGDIILKKEIAIDNFDNALSLEEKLAQLAILSLLEALQKIENKEVTFMKQDNNKASYAPKLKKLDGKIDWHKNAYQIRDQVRGCIPWPGAYTFFDKKMIKIWDVEVIDFGENKQQQPGTIVALRKNGILVATIDKFLLIRELQSASGKRLTAWQFIQGHSFKEGDILR